MNRASFDRLEVMSFTLLKIRLSTSRIRILVV